METTVITYSALPIPPILPYTPPILPIPIHPYLSHKPQRNLPNHLVAPTTRPTPTNPLSLSQRTERAPHLLLFPQPHAS